MLGCKWWLPTELLWVPPVSGSAAGAEGTACPGAKNQCKRVSLHQAAAEASIPLGGDRQLPINSGLRPGGRRDAAAALGISRPTLDKKIEDYGLVVEKRRA